MDHNLTPPQGIWPLNISLLVWWNFFCCLCISSRSENYLILFLAIIDTCITINAHVFASTWSLMFLGFECGGGCVYVCDCVLIKWYAGWQIQQKPATVQLMLEEALEKITNLSREKLVLIGASRTDTGVHALGQAGGLCNQFIKLLLLRCVVDLISQGIRQIRVRL